MKIRLIRLIRQIRPIFFLLSACLVAIALILIYSYFNSKSASAAWWDDNWAYRKAVSITNSSGGALTDFQVSFTIDTTDGAKFQSDCDDIRLVDTNSKQLSYWIEEDNPGCNNAATQIWTKVSSIPTSGTTIYVYYGNPTASSVSNGSNVFQFFDDFNSDTLNSQWTFVNSSYGGDSYSLTAVTDELQISGSLQDSHSTLSLMKRTAESGDYVMEVMMNGTWDTNYKNSGLYVGDGVTNYNNWTGVLGQVMHESSGAPHTAVWGDKREGSRSVATPVRYTEPSYPANKLMRFTKAGTTYKTSAYISGAWVDGTDQSYTSSTTYNGITANNDDGVSTFTASFDNFRTRKYASTQPSSSVGSEEKGTGPVLSWRFDDGQGTTAQDSSINNLDGTLNNTPAWKTEDTCIYGRCLYFDGSNNENVSKADDAKLDFVAADSFTVQAWVKRNSASSANNIILGKASANIGSTYQGYKLYMDASGDFCFDTQDGTLAVDTACTSGVDFDDDKWHLVQGVKTGTTKLELYVDGNLRASDLSIASTGSLANSGTFYAGIDSDGLAIDWLGFIDELKVYPYARSVTQVKLDYVTKTSTEGSGSLLGGQSNGKIISDGLVGYWAMDETTNGAAATDSSGNSTSLTDSGTTARATAKFANGSDFELDSSQYQYAADNALLSITGDLTVSTWIKPESVTASTQFNIAGKFDGANESYLLSQFGDEIRMYIDSSSNYATTDAANLAASSWYHITAVYRASAQTVTIYVNGVAQASTVTGTIPSSIGDDAGRFHVGAEDSTTTAANFYDGIIDDVRVYSRALSNTEVSYLSNWGPSPLLYYDLNEKSGTTANDKGTGANNGTLTQDAGTGGDDITPTWNASGRYGGGVYFDGVEDYITTGNPSNLTDLTNGDFTVELWLYKIAGGGTTYNIINKDNNGNNGWAIFTRGGSNQTLTFRIGYTTTDLSYATAAGIGDGAWFHITAIYKRSLDRGYIYINGIETAYSGTPQAGVGTPQSDSTRNLEIGRQNNTTPNQHYKGTIDDIKIYNYARTSRQILEDFNTNHSPSGGSDALAGYWKFDEGYGTLASNSTGPVAINTLTLSAASWTTAGKFGKAFAGADNTRITRNDDPDFDMAETDGFTLSVWFKRDTVSAQENLIQKLGATATTTGYTLYMDSDGDIVFGIGDANSGSFPEETIGGSLSKNYDDNAWHHAVAVKNGTSSIKLYVDGKEIASDTSLAVDATLANDGKLIIGDANETNGTDEFLGTIDELKIYRTALTAEDIKIDYNRSSSIALGALGNLSTLSNQAAGQEYCIPGDASTCTAPVGEWKLEEGSSTTANDTAGNTNTGTITAGSGGWVGGKIGKAYNFDGASTRISAGSGSTLDNLPAAGMTLEAWIYPKSLGENSLGFIATKNVGTTPSSGWILNLDASYALTFTVDGSTDLVQTTATSAVTQYAWNHVAVSWDGVITTASSVHIYVNGKEVSYATTTNGASRVTDASSTFYIGNDSTSARTFDGYIDHISAFNYARSAAQIAWDYNKGKPVAHWKLDECQGATANDSSGNSYTGTITIGASGAQTTIGTCSTPTDGTGAWYNGVTGKRNYSLKLDGTDDYTSVTDTANLRFDSSTQDFSLFAWVKRAATGTEYIISKEDADNDGYRLLFTSSNTVQCSEDTTDVTSTSTITDTNWHLIGCSIDRDGNGQVYIDGRADGSVVSMGTDAMATTSSITFGTRSYTSTNYFNGQIDDVRIYNYALTATQVKGLLNEGAVRFGPSTGSP